MNVYARTRTLILGIGNPLRGDDGLGGAVAEQLAQAGDLDCEVRIVHQLTPELAQPMALAKLVIMIDASHTGEPGEIGIRLLSSAGQTGSVGSHSTLPEELVALATTVYGHCPPVMVITMTGADFSLGEQFSPEVARRLPLVSIAVRKELQKIGQLTEK